MNRDNRPVLTCSFCDKTQREVQRLIAGNRANICDECADVCSEIIIEKSIEKLEREQGWTGRVSAFDMNAASLADRAQRFAFSCDRAVKLPRPLAEKARALADEIELFASSKDGSRAVLSEYATGIMTVARHFATACDALELPGELAQRARTLADEIEEIFSPVSR